MKRFFLLIFCAILTLLYFSLRNEESNTIEKKLSVNNDPKLQATQVPDQEVTEIEKRIEKRQVTLKDLEENEKEYQVKPVTSLSDEQREEFKRLDPLEQGEGLDSLPVQYVEPTVSAEGEA